MSWGQLAAFFIVATPGVIAITLAALHYDWPSSAQLVSSFLWGALASGSGPTRTIGEWLER